jgi:chemotaxis protein MotB
MFYRNLALVGVLVALVALAGCSCKEFEDQIPLLDAQISELQVQNEEQKAIIGERGELAAELRSNLKDCQADNAVLVEESEEEVIMTIQHEVLFQSGQVMILDTMVPTLQAIASSIESRPNWNVFVEGYTDSHKITEEWQEQYPTNWELGAFRAAAVVRYLTNDLNLPAERFAVVSYGPFRPVADNETAEGRAKNRMLRIVMRRVDQ